MILTLKELSIQIKMLLEGEFAEVQISAEIFQYTRHVASGHSYITLKEDDMILDAVCWRSTKTTDPITHGMSMILTGRITTYPGRSKYQLIISNAQFNADGILLQKFELLKQKLLAEGLFDAARKKLLPSMPSKIGVITSESGAVIEDLRVQFARCMPTEVIVSPASVQGESAVSEIIAALKKLAALRVDVIILARGGGSADDLAAFNDELLVRAVVSCSIPIISAIGHETDTTLCDFVADLRSPTPTAAPSLILPLSADLLQESQGYMLRASSLLRGYFEKKRVQLTNASRLTKGLNGICDLHIQMIDYKLETIQNRLRERLKALIPKLALPQISDYWIQSVKMLSIEQALKRFHALLNDARLRIEMTDPQNVLRRGFCMVRGLQDHKYYSSAHNCPKKIAVVFYDGEVEF